MLERVSPRPTVLFTLLEVDDGRTAVNDVIRDRVESHPNVLIVEFAEAGGDDVALLDDDGLELTEDGMKRFSIRTAAAFGKAPGDDDGTCLPSDYVDDYRRRHVRLSSAAESVDGGQVAHDGEARRAPRSPRRTPSPGCGR